MSATSNQPACVNTLYYGDNLDILRRCVADESVDLVYLDPSFSSSADYNALESDGATNQIIFSVKGGHADVSDVSDLRGVIDQEKALIGVLLSLQAPAHPMWTGAASAGFHESHRGKHPRLQVLSIAELLPGKQVDMPPIQQVNRTFEQASKAKPAAEAEVPQLWDGEQG